MTKDGDPIIGNNQLFVDKNDHDLNIADLDFLKRNLPPDPYAENLSCLTPFGLMWRNTPQGLVISGGPTDNEIINLGQNLDKVYANPYYNGRVAKLIYHHQGDEDDTQVVFYNGRMMARDQFTDIEPQLRDQAMTEEVSQFLGDHHLLMFVDHRVKNLRGKETPLLVITFFDASRYHTDPKCSPLYDTEVIHVDVVDFDFVYPIWDEEGRRNPLPTKADLQLRFRTPDGIGDTTFSVREKVLHLPPYNKLTAYEYINRHDPVTKSSDLNLDHLSTATISAGNLLKNIPPPSSESNSSIQQGSAR